MQHKIIINVSLTVPLGREFDVPCEVRAHAFFIHLDLHRPPVLTAIDLEAVTIDGYPLSQPEIDRLPYDTIAEIMEQTECIARQCID